MQITIGMETGTIIETGMEIETTIVTSLSEISRIIGMGIMETSGKIVGIILLTAMGIGNGVIAITTKATTTTTLKTTI